jgi:hypothetical protein
MGVAEIAMCVLHRATNLAVRRGADREGSIGAFDHERPVSIPVPTPPEL